MRKVKHLCRLCRTPLDLTLVNLGWSPPSNAFRTEEDLDLPEVRLPLHARVCRSCWLVQLPLCEAPEAIFRDYIYFSSYSDSWLAHCRAFAGEATTRLRLGAAHRVVEIASNDGYLLQFFRNAGIPVLGIEPAANVAAVAEARGIPTLPCFFTQDLGRALAEEGHAADLLLGFNVLAHVPDLHDFTEGLRQALKPGGTLVMEFPHLLRLLEGLQFDTIYHEHYSYLSLLAVENLLGKHSLALFDVDEVPTHGGSLRIWAGHAEDPRAGIETTGLRSIRAAEKRARLDQSEGYAGFAGSAVTLKNDLVAFLIEQKRAGKRVAGYGAPAKGNTLLNFAGIQKDLLPFTVDRSIHKQGRFLPGSGIPVLPPEALLEARPDYVLILPWNLKEEVMDQMAAVRSWGGRFVVAIPRIKVLP